ncbi:hypothetical protein ACMHYJ_11255 [Castellaniella hirudinis]|uniref:hypothetical protein n=1 Tax=Castellaniella hirudinis TaxID=1144617 RepID=UPI0039C4A836
MGEARRRGNREQREREAIKRNKRELAEAMGMADDDPTRQALKAGLKPFLDRMTPEHWQQRRDAVLGYLRERVNGPKLAEAQSIRVREDEMGWYLFLCDQAINDPLCTDVSQSQRILPFFAGLGARWQHAHRVVGIERKLDELLKEHRKQPDGLFFEVLVSLAYAEEGWDVTFIEEGQDKTPDMRIVRGDQEFFVECKRMDRTTGYSEKERNQFLRLWDAGHHILLEKHQWVWFKGTFHVDPAELPDNFLLDLWQSSLPIGSGERVLMDNDQATIKARLINQARVRRHMGEFRVKAYSPMLTQVIGGDWAPEDASVTLFPLVKSGYVNGCDVPELGMYVEDVLFACGFTRNFDSEMSIEKKAKDIKKLLSDAVKQVPRDKPSIIHLAAETMEGADVERRRTEKLLVGMPDFDFGDAPVALVRFHRLHAHQRASILFELDETVDDLRVQGIVPSQVPRTVVAPQNSPMQHGAHWNLYP